MTLGDLLVRAKLITVEQMNQALELQSAQGGRFGDHLVATGAISRPALDAFIHRTPPEHDTLVVAALEMVRIFVFARAGDPDHASDSANVLKCSFTTRLRCMPNAPLVGAHRS